MDESLAAPDDGNAYSNLGVQQYSVDHVVVIAVTGEVDALTAPHLSAAIDTALAGSPTAVIVDLSAVEFLASAGMSVLVAAHEVTTDVSARFGVVADGPI